MRFRSLVLVLVLTAASAAGQDFLSGKGPYRKTLEKEIGIDQKLNQQIPLDLTFRDELGRAVRLGQYFGEKPVMLTLVYYSCPMLCNMVLDGVVNSIRELRFDAGKEYEIVTVSFDPRETPALAAEKKSLYTKRYGRKGVAEGWHFLTGDEKSIKALTSAVGFRYKYDQRIKQYAHGTATMIVTPQGRVARYFYGIDIPARDLRLGLIEASKNKIGKFTDQLLLLCYHYDPATGRYSASAMTAVRASGLVTVLGIAGMILFMNRKNRAADAGRRDNRTDPRHHG